MNMLPTFIDTLLIRDNEIISEPPAGFSWNAFLWNWFWCIEVRQWNLALVIFFLPSTISLIPGFGIIVGLPLELIIGVFLGIYGHRIAWKREFKHNQDIEKYRRWNSRMIILWFVMALILGLLIATLGIQMAYLVSDKIINLY